MFIYIIICLFIHSFIYLFWVFFIIFIYLSIHQYIFSFFHFWFHYLFHIHLFINLLNHWSVILIYFFNTYSIHPIANISCFIYVYWHPIFFYSYVKLRNGLFPIDNETCMFSRLVSYNRYINDLIYCTLYQKIDTS